MSCDAFDGLAPELARGSLPAGAEARAREHAAGCGPCGERLAAELRLSRSLGELAAADAETEAPPALKARLRRELRGRRRDARSRRRLPAWAWPLAAAAAGLALWSALAKRPARAGDARVRDAEFRPLFYGGLDDVDSYQVVRVELSRSALLGLGYAVDAGFGARAVSADVVVGQDGVARGIRLVSSGSFTRPRGGPE